MDKENRLINYYNEELKRNFFIFSSGSKKLDQQALDKRAYTDVFEEKFHVPPFEDYTPNSVLDLGSNIGLTMAHYRYLWPSAQIVGYEIDDDNIALSYANTRGMKVHKAAITNFTSVAYKKEGSDQAYKIKYAFVLLDRDLVSVPTRTLDEALNSMQTRDGIVDFVKMDIEGQELPVLTGPGAWPHRIRNLLVECHGINDDDTERNTEIIKRALIYKGFNVKRHEPHWSALFAWKNF